MLKDVTTHMQINTNSICSFSYGTRVTSPQGVFQGSLLFASNMNKQGPYFILQLLFVTSYHCSTAQVGGGLSGLC